MFNIKHSNPYCNNKNVLIKGSSIYSVTRCMPYFSIYVFPQSNMIVTFPGHTQLGFFKQMIKSINYNDYCTIQKTLAQTNTSISFLRS